MSHRLIRFGPAALFAASLLAGMSARAGIVSTSGQLTVVTPPPSVAAGADESSTTAIVFRENLATVATGGLGVDIATPGPYFGGGTAPAPGTIAAGTMVESYLIHSDPVGVTLTEYKGSVTFDTAVLGLDIVAASLFATDTAYGHAGTTYSSDIGRQLESDDSVTLSADRRTVTFDLMTSTVVDDIRIFTAVPEPSTLAMTALSTGALLAVAGLRRRRPVA